MPTPGYIWVETTYLHYIDGDGLERAQQGVLVGASGTRGYLWIEGNNLHYIDNDGQERYLPYGDGTATGAVPGYIWIQNSGARDHYVNYIISGGTGKYWHTDVASHDDHGNVGPSHSNIAHSDWSQYQESAHVDSHDDAVFGQYYDVIYGYIDYPHGDWTDSSPWGDYSVYGDTAHADYTVHSDAHGDTAHQDEPALV